MNFLVTEGYADAARVFREETGGECGDGGAPVLAGGAAPPCMMLCCGRSIRASPPASVPFTCARPLTPSCAAAIDLRSLEERDSIRVAVQQGNVDEAIERANDLNPEVRTHAYQIRSAHGCAEQSGSVTALVSRAHASA